MSESPSRSLEEDVFGPYWRQAMCQPYLAIEYFHRRFGLARTAYYDLIAHRIKITQLAQPGATTTVKGRAMFCLHVVEACDALAEEAMARARAPAEGDAPTGASSSMGGGQAG